jgi:hypothetical protein
MSVSQNARALGAALVGAAIGGLAGYLLFTPEGRRMCRRIEPALDELQQELNSFRSTVQKAASVASDGWRILNEAIGEGPSVPRYASPHQTAPF